MFTFIFTSISITGLAIFVGKLLTESTYFSLPRFSKKLDRKPFNCKPCFTFHLFWIAYTVAAIVLNSWAIGLVGICLSWLIFFILYITTNSKIDE